jgi:hypothetical protein
VLEVVKEGAALSGEHVLPGWTIGTGELFGKLDEEMEKH